MVWTMGADQRGAPSSVELGDADAGAVLQLVVALDRGGDLDAPAERRSEVDELVAAVRRAGEHVGTEALVGDGGVGLADEGGDLAVAHPAVAVGVGGTVEAGADLVTEDARLEALPFVALP